MKQPTIRGRKLPRNDWEGDDFTPGAGGKFVTCLDTAVGRAVSYATNGRIDKDGRVFRAAIVPSDPDGITLMQAHDAVWKIARIQLITPKWLDRKIKQHLVDARGLVILGKYNTIPRIYRYQPNANFDHAIWSSHYSEKVRGFRIWDPLNPDTTQYGRWIPERFIWDFIKSLNNLVAYVPLQP